MQLTIEVRNKMNAGLHWKPTQTTLRGALDFRATGDPEFFALSMKLPDGVPGQCIRLDTGERRAVIYDPLNLPEHESTRNRLEQTIKAASPLSGRLKFAESQDFKEVDLPTWVYWLKRAVEAGYAVVLSGNLDAVKVEGPVRKEFLHAKREDPKERTVEALLKQNQALIALLVEHLPEAKKAKLKDVLN
jgi:hypothetical protein